MLVVLGSTIYTITKIQKRSEDAGIVNPTDEVLMANRLLEASLMGKITQKMFLICFPIPALLFCGTKLRWVIEQAGVSCVYM